MRKFTMLTAVLLLSLAQALLAQHSGHDMGGMTGMNHDDNAMRQMQKMMTMQANDEQRSRFLEWSRSTASVKQRIEELRQAVATNNYSEQLGTFRAALETNASGSNDFAGSLTQEQQKELKKRLQKVDKAKSELTAATETAIRDLTQGNGGGNSLAQLDKARKAVDKLLHEQQGIAGEMGIA